MVDPRLFYAYSISKHFAKEVNMMKKLFAILTALVVLGLAHAWADSPALSLRADYTLSQGRVTIYWLDERHGAPYTLTFQCAEDTLDPQAEFIQTGIMERSYTLDYLAPGCSYSITLEDQYGHSDTMLVQVPEAEPFQDGLLTARHISSGAALRSRPVFWQTAQDIHSETHVAAASIMEDMGVKEYGIRYFLGYPELKQTRFYHTKLVFRAPGGFQYVYYLGQVPYSSGGAPSIKMTWDFIGNEFFEYLYEQTSAVVPGIYTVDCYWDGMAVTSATFELQ